MSKSTKNQESDNSTLNAQELENLTLSLAKASTKPASLRDDYTFSWCKSLRITKPGDKDALKANFPAKGNEFMPLSGGVFDVKEYLEKGYAINSGHFVKNIRNKANSHRLGLFQADIDNTGIDSEGNKIYEEQLTLDNALKHPIIGKYGAIKTSASHTAEWNKIHLYFFLPLEIDSNTYESIFELLNALCNNAFDTSCRDSSHFFYGCSYATFHNWDNVQMLPSEFVSYAKSLADRRKNEVEEKKAKRTAKLSDRKQNLSDTDINEVLTALDWISSEDYYDWIRVGMALKSHSESNFEIWDRWSSQSHKYNPSEIERKWNSFKKDGIGIGTIFWLASQNGYVFENVAINQYLEDESQILEQCYKELGKEISKDEYEEVRFYSEIKDNTEKVNNLILRWFGGHKLKEYVPDPIDRGYIEYSTDEEKLGIIREYDTVIDISDTGTGKSTFIGKNAKKILWQNQLDKLFLIDKNHNNPSTPEVRTTFTNLFPRHKGMIITKDGVMTRYEDGQDIPNDATFTDNSKNLEKLRHR